MTALDICLSKLAEAGITEAAVAAYSRQHGVSMLRAARRLIDSL
jgi:hypothetical protein